MSSDLFKVTEHRVPAQHIREYPRGARSDGDVLELSVKHYAPTERTADEKTLVTIIAAHANGFPKVSGPREVPMWA